MKTLKQIEQRIESAKRQLVMVEKMVVAPDMSGKVGQPKRSGLINTKAQIETLNKLKELSNQEAEKIMEEVRARGSLGDDKCHDDGQITSIEWFLNDE